MATAPPLRLPRRETLVDAVAERLIQYIAQEGLRAGDRLPSERELVAMLGASRLPLREALSVLKGLGIIEAQHGKGIFVRQLDMAGVFSMLSPLLRTHAQIDLRHIFQARLLLEGQVAELAAQHRSADDLAALDRAVAGMRESVRQRRVYIELDTAFHQQLARSAGNPIFHVFMCSLTDLLRELQFRYRDRLEYRAAALEEHAEVLEAVRARDARQAGEAMRRHLRHAMERIP